ncbi:MAG TPA: alpha/beta hydrolase-fold protein, partial [Acidimicrobiales bacterium]|nr:alpha/beta hydrolase-fold protein [Acidimicrobiales bacterium]
MTLAEAPEPPDQTAAGPDLSDLPDRVPPAATAAEPALPIPSGWPFADAFPRTSGTSRLTSGALEYSDFLYDDHGARGVNRSFPVAGLAPSDGTYEYASADARKNGADIFRVGIGRDGDASYWRVDWTTLVNPDIPVAEFAIDSAPGGSDTWPGLSGLKSPGIDQALVVSSKGAWLLDSASAKTPVGTVTVDTAARSFVVRIPSADLPVGGAWTVRVASGQANPAGDGFAPVDTDHGSTGLTPPVFNVGFRGYHQEPEKDNYWMEDAQAQALTLGDVSQFSAVVDWAALAAGTETPEPLPTGYLNRWYASSIVVGDGQGVVADGGQGTGDLKPNFLGRVQPYAVYVPTTYDPATPTKLTWLLHSLSEQHNQYFALAPNWVQQSCEDRGSICATTLGRGPDGWYFDEAELDFWEVWNRLASAFTLDPEKTVISGYSMGGWGTYKLGLANPDLFAKAVVLAGPPGCGLRFAQGYGGAGGPGRCTTDGNSTPFLGNALWLPYYIAHGTDDELVPVTSVLEQVNEFKKTGNRFRFELYPGMDHLAYGAADHYASAAAHMGNGSRVRNPGQVVLGWYPHLDRPEWGLTEMGAYWVHQPTARTS